MAVKLHDRVSKTTKKISRSVRRMKDKSVGALKKMLKEVVTLRGAFAGLAAIAAGALAVQGVKQMLDDTARLGVFADRLEVSTEFLSGLGFAARTTGQDLDVAQDALETLAERIIDAKEGSEDAASAFRLIGINSRDLGGTEEAFNAVAEAVSKVADRKEQFVALDRIFGSAGRNLINILPNLKELSREADLFGATIGRDTVEEARRFDRAIIQLGEASGSVFRQVVVHLSERLVPAIRTASLFLVENGSSLIEFGKQAVTYVFLLAKSVAGIVGDIAGPVYELLSKSQEDLAEEIEETKKALNSVGASIGKLNKDSGSVTNIFGEQATEQLRVYQTLLDEVASKQQELQDSRDMAAALEKLKAAGKGIADEVSKIFIDLDQETADRKSSARIPGLPSADDISAARRFGDEILVESARIQREAEASMLKGFAQQKAMLSAEYSSRIEELKNNLEQQKLTIDAYHASVRAEAVKAERALTDIQTAEARQRNELLSQIHEAEAIASGGDNRVQGIRDASQLRIDDLNAQAEKIPELRDEFHQLAQAEAAAAAQAEAEITNFNDGFGAGIRDATKGYKEFGDVGKEVAGVLFTAVTDGAVEIGEALASSWSEGKQAAKDYGRQVLKMLAQIAAKAIASKIASSLVTQAADGGVFPGHIQGLQYAGSFARGGVVPSIPQMALVGEGGKREAVVPLPDNRHIPVEIRGPMGEQKQLNIAFHVSAIDDRSVEGWLGRKKNEIIGMVQEAMENDSDMIQSMRGASA